MISEVSPGSEFLAVWRRRDLRDPLKVPGKPFHKVGRERGAYKGSKLLYGAYDGLAGNGKIS